MESYNKVGIRIPKKYRNNKESAKLFVDWFKANNVKIINPDIFVLKNWIYPNETAKIVSVEYDWPTNVYDVSVKDDHSFFGNSVSMHNCNLPNDASKELVSNVYMKAWESGCKGFTVYRDGSRAGVLVSTDAKKNESFETKNAPKRPESLKCDIKQVKIKNENWTVVVGLFENKPYEIFAGRSSFVSIPKKVASGHLIKNPKKKGSNKSIYDLKFGDESDPVVIKDIAKIFENPTEGEFTRLLSLSLRHGAPVQYIVEQLQKDEESDMFSFSRVIARVLKIYIKDGVLTKETCPNCGSEVVYIEGCKQCKSKCGWSKCG